MALNFGALDQGGPSGFYQGFTQAGEKMQANAMAQQKAAQAQQEFGMRQQEFAAGQADKKRAADAAMVTQKLGSYKDALLRSRNAVDARRIVEMQYADPDIGPIRSRLSPLEQALAEVPDEPTAFQKYLEDEAMGMEEVRKMQGRDRAFATAMGGAQAMPQAAPTNAMAPVGSAAPVAPANAMVAPAVSGELQNKLAQLERLTALADQNPRVKATIDQLNKDVARLSPAAGAQPLAEFSAFLKLPPDQQAEFMRFKKAGAANISASATTSPTGKSLSEPVGKRVETSLVKAEGATSMMDTANSVREALNTGNVIAGPLAGVRTKFAQVLELAGAGDKEKLINTRSAIQGLAGLTLESRAELRGQGQITDTETKLLEKARSADINDMTIPELQQIVSVSQRLASRLFSNHQTLLGRMKDDPAAKDSMRYYEPTGQMAAPTLEGKTPAVQSKDAKRPSLGSIFGGSPQGGK
jgi:hypothetical protein